MSPVLSWLTGSTSNETEKTPIASSRVPEENAAESSVSVSVSPPELNGNSINGRNQDEEVDSDDDDDRSDTPPAFPAPNSAQRLNVSQSTQGLPSFLTATQCMPPPPSPAKALRVPGVYTSSGISSRAGNGLLGANLSLPTSSSSMLALPPSTSKPPTKKFREKVALAPGFGPLDWAALKSSGSDLRVRLVFPSFLRLYFFLLMMRRYIHVYVVLSINP